MRIIKFLSYLCFSTSLLVYLFLSSSFKPDDSHSSVTNTESKDADEIRTSQNYVVLAGGGDEGHSSIPNAIVVSLPRRFRFQFSLRPTYLPYRMTVHPRGDGSICALQQSCRLFEWKEHEGEEVH